MRTLPILLLAASLGVAGSGQGEADPDAHLDDLNLGTWWYGKKVDLRDLKGKVVLVELWGS